MVKSNSIRETPTFKKSEILIPKSETNSNYQNSNYVLPQGIKKADIQFECPL